MLTFDVIIVGAGIVGCACARACSQNGLSVAVIESNYVGGGATAAGMGHLVVMDDSPAQFALTRYSLSLWNTLAPELPANVEYQQRGTLWVAADEEEMAFVRAKAASYAEAGIPASILDTSAIAAEEPNLRPGLAGGLLVHRDAIIYAPTAASFLLAEALNHGAMLIHGNRILSMHHGLIKLENGDHFAAAQIVVATGDNTALLPWLPVQKRKGHLIITDRYPGFLRHQLVELGYLKSAHDSTIDSVAFNVQPRCTGQILIGSSRQSGQEDDAIDHSILQQMLDRATSYMPRLSSLNALRVWTGHRAATPDHLPLIGPTGQERIMVAMGFEGLGITNALGAANLVADQVMQRTSAIDQSPYLPERFAVQEAAYA